MTNRYLDKVTAGKEYKNFFHKLEDSLFSLHIQGILTDSEYDKARARLVKKFLASLKKGKYKSTRRLSIGHTDGDIKINRDDIIELVKTDKSKQEISFAYGEFQYGMRFDFMLNFEPVE